MDQPERRTAPAPWHLRLWRWLTGDGGEVNWEFEVWAPPW